MIEYPTTAPTKAPKHSPFTELPSQSVLSYLAPRTNRGAAAITPTNTTSTRTTNCQSLLASERCRSGSSRNEPTKHRHHHDLQLIPLCLLWFRERYRRLLNGYCQDATQHEHDGTQGEPCHIAFIVASLMLTYKRSPYRLSCLVLR